jgi:hypothetical protein
VRPLRLIWQIPRRHHLATQYQALFEAINIHKEFCGEKVDPKPSTTLLNKTDTCDGYGFNINIINNDEYNALQKELLMLFEAYCILGFREFYKKMVVFWWKWK